MNRLRRQAGQSRRFEKGIATIETMIATPIVIVVMLAVAELGNAFIQYNALTHGVRDGARFLASAANGTGGATDLDADDIATATQLVAYGTVGTGTPIVPGLAPGNVTVVNNGDGTFSVTVAYDYQPIVAGGIPSFFGGSANGGTFTMRAGIVMRVIA